MRYSQLSMNIQDTFREIYPYLVLLYLLDGVVFLRSGHLLLSSQTGRYFAARLGKGIRLANLLPTGQAFLLSMRPVLWDTKGIWHLPDEVSHERAAIRQTDFVHVCYDAVNELYVDRKSLLLNGRHRLRFAIEEEARYNAGKLERLRSAGNEERERLLVDFSSAEISGDLIRERVHTAALPLRVATIEGTWFFLALFVLLPPALYDVFGSGRFLEMVLYLAAAGYLMAPLTAFACARALYPENTRVAWNHLFTALFSPLSGVHLRSHLARTLFHSSNPVAVAASVLASESLVNLVRMPYLQLKDMVAGATGDFSVALVRTLHDFEEILTRHDVDPSTLGIRRVPRDPDARAYCSHCGGEYRSEALQCSDCAVPLRLYHQPPP